MGLESSWTSCKHGRWRWTYSKFKNKHAVLFCILLHPVSSRMGCSLHDHGHGHSHSGDSHTHSHNPKEASSHKTNQENMNVRAAFIHVISGEIAFNYANVQHDSLGFSRFRSILWSLSGGTRHILQTWMVNYRSNLYFFVLDPCSLYNAENIERRRSGKWICFRLSIENYYR